MSSKMKKPEKFIVIAVSLTLLIGGVFGIAYSSNAQQSHLGFFKEDSSKMEKQEKDGLGFFQLDLLVL